MSDLRAVGLLSPLQFDSDTAIELWVESEAEVQTIFNTNAEKVQTLGSDNEILLLQIAQLQEELEANYTEQQKLRAAHKTEVTELKEANERLQRDNANDTIKLSEVGAKTKELELEVEVQLLQIAQLQEELEANYTEQQKLRAAHEADVTELKEANERLQRDNANDTIKLSEVGAKTKELELEGKVQLLQIAQLQEELEYYFSKVKATEDEKAVYNEVETAPNLSMARALISRLFKAETSVAES